MFANVHLLHATKLRLLVASVCFASLNGFAQASIRFDGQRATPTAVQQEPSASTSDSQSGPSRVSRVRGRNPYVLRLVPPHDAKSFERFVDYCERHQLQYKLSLRKLSRELKQAMAARKREPHLQGVANVPREILYHVPPEIRYLHGFTWFFGYIVDRHNGDVVLLGIKNPDLPPIDMDCLATAIMAVYTGKTPGCSLDKHDEQKWQKSRVDGIDWENRWAEIMIDADYLMKRISQSRVDPGIDGLEPWWNKVQRSLQANTGRAQMNRWWYDRPRQHVETTRQLDNRGDIAILFENPVLLRTEEEIKGKFGTGSTAVEADEFARQFTEKLVQLGRKYQSIGELLALYRMLDLVAHIKELGNVPAVAWKDLIQAYPPSYEGPQHVYPTLTRETRTSDGNGVTVWKLAGGVRMPVSVDLKHVRKDRISDDLRERLMHRPD